LDRNNPPFHLPGLNGLRAIAAITVVISHIDQFSYLFKINKIGIDNKNLSGHAVTLFFVLSGYLITYLLLLEKDKYKKIDFRKFYIRRILRIWPVYYLVVVIVFILFVIGVMDKSNVHWSYFAFYVFFIPNVAYSWTLTVGALTPLWSVGVEEQFYAFWPLVISKSKNILNALIFIIVLYLVIKFVSQILSIKGIISPFVNGLIVNTRFDCMALGGIGACLVTVNSKWLPIIYNKYLQIFCWLILVYSVIFKSLHVGSIIDPEIYAVIFLIIIINVSTNPSTVIKLEKPIFNFFGKISYGMYVYHLLLIYLIHYFVGNFNNNSIASVIILFVMILGSSILVAWLSYTYFEKGFLKAKTKYMKIYSSNSN
jgi:peptidoglycan/LPS O-acetylase OafA/YrhL